VTRHTTGRADVVETYTYNVLGALKTNARVVLDDQRPKLSGGGTAGAGVPANYGGQPVTLNSVGRVTAMEGATLAYTNLGNVKSVTSGSTTDSYSYDAFCGEPCASRRD